MITVTDRRIKIEWAHFLGQISDTWPAAKKITLIMDNLNIHKPGSLYEPFPAAQTKELWDGFEFVYTPKHGRNKVADVEPAMFKQKALYD